AHERRFDEAELANLLEGCAIECYTTGDGQQAVNLQRRTVTLRRHLGDDAVTGASLRWLSRMHWWNADRRSASTVADEAIAVLEPLGASPALAMAYSNRSQLAMLAHEEDDARHWGQRATELARALGAEEILAHGLTNLGAVSFRSDATAGARTLVQALAVARRVGDIPEVCRVLTTLGWGSLDRHDLEAAARWVGEGIMVAEEEEQLGFLSYLRVLRARLHLEAGRWAEADAECREVLSWPSLPWTTQMPLRFVLGRLQARRGEDAAADTLAEGWAVALRADELQRLAPLAVARAELAWLADDAAQAWEAVASTLSLAQANRSHRLGTELGYWAWKAGQPQAAMPLPDHPWALQVAGRWEEAAARWAAAGYPYEQAMALAEGDRPDALMAALAIADGLGAAPLGARLRTRLKELGVGRVPRGPATSTRADPAGLTGRQREVFDLLAEGCTNADIADRLVLSVRTVDHHVSAILAKLGAATRAEAVRIGAALDGAG
ncbi:MAG TPA: LuxR C-terminal-related transcriptional regulator, partial [Euzebya sp.]|nr:LuxR C-terminal-related transcriptional regulator [Euzebya sp.]